MGKNRQRQNRDTSASHNRRAASRRSDASSSATTSSSSTATTAQVTEASSSSVTTTAATTTTSRKRSMLEWCRDEQEGLLWVLGCALVGSLFGFGIGTGHLTGAIGETTTSPWRDALGYKIRSSAVFRIGTLQTKPWEPMLDFYQHVASGGRDDASFRMRGEKGESWKNDPSHPTTFAVLREAVVREEGGYVHPDLGVLSPAPCGAARGLGMVSSTYTECQINCFPGVASEKQKHANETSSNKKDDAPKSYKQEEVLLRIPLSFQMTRNVGLDTILPLIPADAQERAPLEELDDAAILVLLLAHERGLGLASRYYPYIASLPIEPSCGYSLKSRPFMLDAVAIMGSQMGFDVNAWPSELAKATAYAGKIATGLARDYGGHLKHPPGVTHKENLDWALCQVASRATAGSEQHGTLRLVPVADMINHDVDAGGFIELTGKERLSKGDFIDATEEDSGTFVVRSLRHGRRKPLKKGQELLVNYNVPAYSPLDWFVSLGFVPRERWARWSKIDAALPRARRGPIAEEPPRASSAGTTTQGTCSD